MFHLVHIAKVETLTNSLNIFLQGFVDQDLYHVLINQIVVSKLLPALLTVNNDLCVKVEDLRGFRMIFLLHLAILVIRLIYLNAILN